MKKLVATLMAALLMLGGTPALAATDTAQNQTALVQEDTSASVQPRATGFLSCSLTKQSSQLKITANCESTYANDIAYYDIDLQRWTGSSWNTVMGWTETRNGNVTSLAKYANPAKGYSYRAYVTVSTASGMHGSVASDPVGW